MIKYFCDRCGKEITGNVNAVAETTEIKDYHDATILTLREMQHICDECQYTELTCGFKVGDRVITDDGRVGIIESFCDCKSCKKRGFYEPTVKMEIGEGQIWITDTDKNNGFMSFYKIGDQVFGNIDEQGVLDRIEYKKKTIQEMNMELFELKAQLNMIKILKNN